VSASFLLALLTGHWDEGGGLAVLGPSVAGLVFGGLFAAPLAGALVRHLRENTLLRRVGILIVLTAGYQTWRAFA
jgi:uncharacterized membrane protein YfcA